jgi:hypothetical protein
MKFKIRSGVILAFSAATRLNSMNSSCERPWESVPMEIRRTRSAGQLNDIDAHILAVRTRIELDRFIQFGNDRKYPRLIGAHSQTEALNAPRG